MLIFKYCMNGLIFNIFIALLSSFIFLFVFWKSLKDDYIPSQIFSTAFSVLIFFGLGCFLSKYSDAFRFWILFASLIVGYIIGFVRSRIKAYEGLDGLIISIAFALLPTALFFINSWDISYSLFYLTLVFVSIIYFSVKRYYKTFIWYKSGRRGFAGLFTLGIIFLIRSLISIFKPDFTLMLMEYDIFISGLISFTAFLNIFVLGSK